MSSELLAHLKSARQTALRLREASPAIRQEWLSGIHNPWGLAARTADAWLFLDICEAPEIVDAAAEAAGPNLVLWDSELFLDGAEYLAFLVAGCEGRYWPADPLAGAVVLVSVTEHDPEFVAASVLAQDGLRMTPRRGVPLYVIRYLAGASRYRRDPDFPANRIAMEERVLLNYATRPLWLVRGSSHPETNLVTGFAPATPRWAGQYSRGS